MGFTQPQDSKFGSELCDLKVEVFCASPLTQIAGMGALVIKTLKAWKGSRRQLRPIQVKCLLQTAA